MAGASISKSAAAGAIGGFLAAAITDQLQTLINRSLQRRQHERAARQERWWRRRVSQAHRPDAAEVLEPAPSVQAGSEQRLAGDLVDRASLTLLNRPLSDAEKRILGPAAYYLYGAALGAGYGAAVESRPMLSVGLGVPFGAVTWLVQDEIAAPLLKLSGLPKEYPASSHVLTLAAHAMFGLITESVRRGMLHLMR